MCPVKQSHQERAVLKTLTENHFLNKLTKRTAKPSAVTGTPESVKYEALTLASETQTQPTMALQIWVTVNSIEGS